MSTFTNNHTWVTGETMTAAILNGITNTLVTAGNAIDRTNLTGGAGIDASQLTPSSASAGKFGGSVAYTFPLALITTVGSNSVVPLTVQGNSGGGQTADLLDVLLQPAGTNFFAINNNGAILPNGNGTIPAASVAIGADAGGTKGIIVNVPTGSSNGIQGQVNGTTLLKMSATGDLQIAPLINSLNVLSRVAPCYSKSGVAVASTFHMVFDSVAFVATNSVTVTLSNNAVFTSGTSYYVTFCDSNAAGQSGGTKNLIQVTAQSSTSIQFNSIDSTTGNLVSITGTYPFVAIGT